MSAKRFLILWISVFLASYGVLSFTGLIPDELKEFNASSIASLQWRAPAASVDGTLPGQGLSSTTPAENIPSVKETILPDRIIIEKIAVDAPVMNPESRDIAVLDQALLSGVVRYPGSGGLDDASNMFLFGHSTNWAVVHNQSYKSFNRLGELQIGDVITVLSGSQEYRYRVFSVALVDKDKALVELGSGEKLITLSTCDTFGQRSDRFVVQARFLEAVSH